MRSRSTLATISMATLVAACSAGSPAPTGAPAPTGTTAAVTPAALPSAASGSGPIASFATPSLTIPSFAPDTTLEGAFPTEIDGQPVSAVESASFLAVLQAFQTDQATIDAFSAAMSAIGVQPGAVSFASASATVGEEQVTIQALRTPAGSAANAIEALIALDPPEVPPTVTTETIGGKSVTVATVDDGDEEFYYASGELAWFLPDADRQQAEVIFAALP